MYLNCVQIIGFQILNIVFNYANMVVLLGEPILRRYGFKYYIQRWNGFLGCSPEPL